VPVLFDLPTAGHRSTERSAMSTTWRDVAVSALETLMQRHGNDYAGPYDRTDVEVFVDAILEAARALQETR